MWLPNPTMKANCGSQKDDSRLDGFTFIVNMSSRNFQLRYWRVHQVPHACALSLTVLLGVVWYTRLLHAAHGCRRTMPATVYRLQGNSLVSSFPFGCDVEQPTASGPRQHSPP